MRITPDRSHMSHGRTESRGPYEELQASPLWHIGSAPTIPGSTLRTTSMAYAAPGFGSPATGFTAPGLPASAYH